MTTIRNLLDPRMTMFHQQTLRESIDETMRGARIAMAFYFPIGAFGLVLACVGLAGVTAQTVAVSYTHLQVIQRRHRQSRRQTRRTLRAGRAHPRHLHVKRTALPRSRRCPERRRLRLRNRI